MKPVLVLSLGLIAASFGAAQEFQKFAFDAGGGFTEPVGGSTRYLNNGWNAGVGFGVNFTQRFSAMVQYAYNDMGVNSATSNLLGVTGGDASVYSITIDPRFRFTPRGPVDFYVVGGGGYYHMHQGWDSHSTATALPDIPFFGISNSLNAPPLPNVPIALPDASIEKPGFNVGAGVEFGHFRGAKAFAEARWDHVFLNHSHFDYLPITFGLRF